MISSDLGQEYKTMSLGLDRIRNFLSDNNIGYKKLKYIHIAGTNGKGSTAKMLATIFENCGYKTGLYTSPHLIKINERIQIDGKYISDKDLSFIEKKYDKAFDKYGLTYFERITAIAFAYFVKNKTDIVVLETGLGGRYDATNIITPLTSVITSIGLDHTEILGKTLKQIAFEKAGIIKENIPVVCGNIPEKALKEICKIAKNKNSQTFLFGKDFNAEFLKYNRNKNSQYVMYNSKTKFEVSLLGKSQVYNVAVVLKTCELLKEKLKNINFNVVKKSLKNIYWPARFDVRKLKIKNKNFSLIIDGGHNEQAVENFLNLYKESPFYKKDGKLCFAIMREKNYKKVIKMLSHNFKNINLIELNNSRAVDTKISEKEFLKYTNKENIRIYDNINDFIDDINDNENVVVLGSFFLAGEVIKFIENKF